MRVGSGCETRFYVFVTPGLKREEASVFSWQKSLGRDLPLWRVVSLVSKTRGRKGEMMEGKALADRLALRLEATEYVGVRF